MSSFLKKLAGIGSSASEAIQPRVPSIFEPHRRDVASFGAKSFVSPNNPQEEKTAEANQESQDGQYALDKNPTREMMDGQPAYIEEIGRARPLRSVSTVPASREPEKTADRAEFDSASRITSVVSDPVIDRSSQAKIEMTETQQGLQKASALPKAMLRRASRKEKATQSSNGIAHIVSDRTLPVLGAHNAISPLSAIPLGKSFAREESEQTHAINVMNDSAGRNANAGSLSEPLIPIRIPPALTRSSVIRPVNSPMPRRSGEEAFGGSRMPIAPGAEFEPAIRVTIGRVDVRAVFPAPTPRRTQPVRSKASLSLDEYLKRRGREQR